jgi:hypothetical protein
MFSWSGGIGKAYVGALLIYIFFRSIPRAGIRFGRKFEHVTASQVEGGGIGNATVPLVSKRVRGTLKRRRSIRPMAGRKNKEGREKAIIDHREVRVGSS